MQLYNALEKQGFKTYKEKIDLIKRIGYNVEIEGEDKEVYEALLDEIVRRKQEDEELLDEVD